MAAQVFHIQHLEAGLFHLDHHVGEARDPAAREDVLADEVIGLEVADVADEVYEAEPAGLERARMGLDEIDQAVAPGVLEAADRHDLVILALHAAEVRFQRHGVLQLLPLDLAARVLDLRAGGVVARDLDAEALLGIKQEAAEAAADVGDLVAGLEEHLLRHVVKLVPLRLFQRAGAFLPVGAGVEHQRIVEPVAVELGPERVVELGVALGAHPVAVRVQPLVRAVGELDQHAALIHARRHAGGEGAGEAALEIDLAVEVGFEEPDVAVHGDAAVGARVAEDQAEVGGRGSGAPFRAVGVTHPERGAGAARHGAQEFVDGGLQGSRFYSPMEADPQLC